MIVFTQLHRAARSTPTRPKRTPGHITCLRARPRSTRGAAAVEVRRSCRERDGARAVRTELDGRRDAARRKSGARGDAALAWAARRRGRTLAGEWRHLRAREAGTTARRSRNVWRLFARIQKMRRIAFVRRGESHRRDLLLCGADVFFFFDAGVFFVDVSGARFFVPVLKVVGCVRKPLSSWRGIT